ncbi:MAG: S-layer homology domain-containing protein [Chloroflexota bacterium]|nr:S-layer homology domain-containing protein [Chloroflexota bacterium]
MIQQENRLSARRMWILIVLLLAVIATSGLLYLQTRGQGKGSGAANGTTAANNPAQGAILPGEETNPRLSGNPSKEIEALRKRQAYFANRFGGTYDPKWLLAGYDEAANMQTGIPAGKVVYDRSKTNSPLALDPNSMVSLGPAPAQTDGCYNCYNSGLVSGRINSVLIDPTMTSTVYLGVSNGGIWKTTNCCTASTQWRPVTDDPSITTLTIDEIVMDPNDNETLYVATGDFRPVGSARGGQGIFKSTDAGETWEVYGEDVFTPRRTNGGADVFAGDGVSGYDVVSAIKVDPNNSNALIAGTKNELFMSYDAGVTWNGPCYTNAYTATQRQDNTEIVVRDMGATSIIYYAVGWVVENANGANGIYTATFPSSGCPTWTLATRGDNGWPAGTGNGTAGYPKPGRIDIAIAPSNPDVMYAAAADSRFLDIGVIYLTTNAGASWQARSDWTDFYACGSNQPGSGDYGQAFYDQAIDVDPNDPMKLYYGEVDAFRSFNGGLNWQNVGCVYSGGDWIHSDQHDYRYVPGSSSEILLANDGGIWYSSNADVVSPTIPTILSLNHTMNTLEFYNGDITGNFANSASPGANGGTQDNGSFVNLWSSQEALGPEQWQLRIGGDGFFAAIEPVKNQIWYQENNASQIWRSTTGPYGAYNLVTPYTASCDDYWGCDSRSFAMPFEIAKHDCPATGCTHLIAGTYRVWEAVDGAVSGTSWYTNSPMLTKTEPQFPGWGGDLYITQLQYAVSMSTTAIVGTNDGNVWYGFNLGQGTPMSADWVNVTGDNEVLPNRPVMDVTTDPITPTIGYAALGGFNESIKGQPGHVFQVTCHACDPGDAKANAPAGVSATWVDKSGNLPDLPAEAIVVNPRFRQQVFVGNDAGLFYTNDIDAATPVWYRFTNGIPNVWVSDLTIDRGGTTLAVWTRNRGLYVWPFPNAPFIQPSPTPTVTGTPPTATATATASTGGSCYQVQVTETEGTIIPATEDTGAYCDDCSPLINFPFPVRIYDRTFSQGYATSNGAIAFDMVSLAYGDDCIPNRNETYTLHAFTTDLCTNQCTEDNTACEGCGIFTSTIGEAPNRKFIVEWRAEYFGFAEYVNFEVVFTEGSDTVSVIYGVDESGADGGFANAGVQKDQTTYYSYSCGDSTLTEGLQVNYTFSECPGATSTPIPTATVIGGETCPIQFADVPPSTSESSFYPYVRCLACRNIIGGYPCGGTNPQTGAAEPCGATQNAYYRPNNNITRGQIAKIVAQSAGYDEDPGLQIYADVPPDQVFWLYIQQLSNDGIMGGYACGGTDPYSGQPEVCDAQDRPFFRPNAPATRGQISKIVANAAGVTYGGSNQTYADVPPSASPSSFYPFVEGLTQMGVMGGYKCGGPGEPCGAGNRPYFRPGALVTRAQAAKIVANTFFPNCETPARP